MGKLIKVVNILLLIFANSLMSCSSQEQKMIDLGNIKPGFDVSGFYREKVKRTNETIARDPRKLDKEEALKLLDNPFFIKDTLCYFKDVSDRLPGDFYIDSKNDWMSKELKPEKIFGYKYLTVSWNETDTLAMLNGITFPKVDMIESKSGDFVWTRAYKSVKDTLVYITLEKFLNAKYSKGKMDPDSGSDKMSDWQNEDFIYVLKEVIRNNEPEIEYTIFSKAYLPAIKETGNRFQGTSFENYNR